MTAIVDGTTGITAPAAALTTPLPEASGGTGLTTVLAATKTALNASGSAPIFGCRAWCNFDGTLTGTNAPRAGGNVTSVTRNGTGDYTITFTTAMPDANYAVQVTVGNNSTGAGLTANSYYSAANTASLVRVATSSGSTNTLSDAPYVCVSIFR